jgi:uncharacterized protein YjbI with pentapeptide repeats
MKKLAHLVMALLLLPAFTFAQTKVDAKEIIAKINRGEAAIYKNAQVEGDLDLTQLANKKLKPEEDENGHHSKVYVSTVTAPVSFTNCTFSGKVLAYYNPNAGEMHVVNSNNEVYNTNFEKEVRFENCTFAREVAFKYSEFKDYVSFAGSEFRDHTLFKYSKFSQGPDFSKATFQESAIFKYVNFPKATDFSQVTFKGDTDFKYAEFAEGVNFQKAAFINSANFKYAKLSNPKLEGATFKGNQDFKYTEVDGRKVHLTELAAK